MELAVITDEISQDLDHALDVMAEYGIYNAEIRGAWGVNIADADDALIEKIAASCKNHGATVVGIASPFYKCDLQVPNGTIDHGKCGPMHGAVRHSFDGQLSVLKRCIEASTVLNTRLIRAFTFWKKGDLTPDVEASIVELFREPARLAEAADVTLIVENEHACYTGTGAQTASVLRAIDSPFVRAVWDPGNAYMASEAPYPDGYNTIKSFVKHVHVKDANSAKEWTVVGEGQIDWSGQLAALKRDGYKGYLSLETHYNGGAGPEESSRQCLVGLKRLFESM